MEEIARFSLAVGIPILVVAILTRNVELVPAVVFPVAVLAVFYAIYGKELKVEVHAELKNTKLKVEDEAVVDIRATSNSPGLFLYKALDDKRLVANGTPTGILYLSGSAGASTTAKAGLPGRYAPSGVEWAFYPLSLSRPIRGYVDVGEVEVRPYLLPAKIKAVATSLGAPRAPGMLAGPHSIEFLEVREYRPGDPYKLINWKAYARNPAVLYINEKLREGHSTIYIVLDASSNCRPDAIGHGASLALSIAQAATAAKFPVGLFITPSGAFLPPTDSPAGLKLFSELLMKVDLKPPWFSPTPPKADVYVYVSCRPDPLYIERLCVKSRRVVVVEVAPARGAFADIERLLAGRDAKKILCADRIVWSPPLERPAKLFRYL
ncbi:MAG: DUF58 domain-containing protein [Thermoproteus sp.]